MDEMFITPIQLMHIGESQAPAVAEKTVGQDGVSMFKSIFQSAIEDVITTDQDLSQAEYLLTTGQIDDPATVTTAAAEAGCGPAGSVEKPGTGSLYAVNEYQHIGNCM